MTDKTANTQTDSKQAIPSPEDRVRAIREKLENVKSGRWHKTLWVQSAPEDVVYLLSLVEEFKGQVVSVSASPQLTCPKCEGNEFSIADGVISCQMWTCDFDSTTAQFFADLLRKRKDYHAEYVEAVEAAEKTQGELGVMREALRKIGDPAAKVDSLMEARMIARAALTPEPASQAAEEKK